MLVMRGIYALESHIDVAEKGILSAVTDIGEFGWTLWTTRGVEGQSKPLYTTYELIPGTYDFFMGRTLSNPRELLPYTRVALAYLICEHLGMAVDPEIMCGAPTVFFGEIYANFGLTISWLAMFNFGVIIQLLNNGLSRRIERERTAFYAAFFYLIMTYIGDFAIGFSPVYFDTRVWFFVLFYTIGRSTLRRRPGVNKAMIARREVGGPSSRGPRGAASGGSSVARISHEAAR
jgi:hypothetical protein